MNATNLNRRAFLGRTSIGFGAAALASMLPQAHAEPSGGLQGLPHFPPTATSASPPENGCAASKMAGITRCPALSM